MRNRVLPFLLILCLLLCACQKQPAQEGLSKSYTQSDMVSENTEANAQGEVLSAPNASASSATDASSVQDGTDNGGVALPVAASGGKGQAADNPQGNADAGVGNADGNPNPGSPKQGTVSFTVDCKNAIAYGILENPNFAGVLPQNGVLFSNADVQFTEGESVMQVLKRELKAQKIPCQMTSGGYVKSIAGLSEKDCGETSGWLYRVNGKLPNVSCKYYTLQAGDRVEFMYTCKMGDVGET